MEKEGRKRRRVRREDREWKMRSYFKLEGGSIGEARIKGGKEGGRQGEGIGQVKLGKHMN